MQDIIDKVAAHIKEKFFGESTGHDWYHIDRVRKLALSMAVEEGANMNVVALGALVHDIADHKFHDGDTEIGPRTAKELLESHGVEADIVERVVDIVKEISYKGANVATPMSSIEGDVVQDADRLDAIGAIGIARTFAYGGARGNGMYDPESNPEMHDSFEDYQAGGNTTINHFYEKLLLLKDRMNTKTAKRVARQRHKLMEEYLEAFYQEWEGKI